MANNQHNLTFMRCLKAKELVRHHAHSIGAPVEITSQACLMASYEVRNHQSVWRATRHAISFLDNQADVTGWWGEPA